MRLNLKFMEALSYKEIRNKLIINTREFIFDLNDKFPLVGRPLVIGWRALCGLKFIVQKKILKIKTRLKYSYETLDLDKVCWINPQKIEYCLEGAFNIWRNYSRILEGDWDQSKTKFEDLDVFQAFAQRFKGGKKWEETDFYHRVLNQITKGIRKWGCRNKEEWDKRLRDIESLYYQIKRDGYKSKKELFSPKGWLEKLEGPSITLDDISVAVGREGQFLFIEGRHRLAIAKLLNLSKIPIKIIARHKKWMDFRKELICFALDYGEGKLYQPLTHPDLQDLPRHHGELRFSIIKEHLSFTQGTLLDIGANLGYFCHKFEEEGFDCYAVESDRMCVYLLKELKKAENREFKVIPGSIFEYNKNQGLKFDVVLALNIFHHFLARKDTYLKLIKFLKKIRVKELFFEPPKPNRAKTKRFYRNYTPDQFVQFIINNSCLNKAELIGEAEDGRPLYKLTCNKSPF